MSDIGAGYLAGGMSNAGRSLGGAIAKYRDQRKVDKQTDSAFDAVGTVMGHMEETGGLPPGIAAKYVEVGKGTPEQKRGFLQGLGHVLQFVEKTTERQSREQDREAARVRAAEYLTIQKDDAARRKSTDERRSRFQGALSQYLQPQPVSVNAGGMSVGLPMQRRLSPEYLVGLAAQHGVDVPEGMVKTLANQPEAPFKPEVVDLGDGVSAMTTSRGSAIPVNKPKSTADKPRMVKVRAENPDDSDEVFTYEIPWEEFEQRRKARAAETPQPNVVQRFDKRGNLIK